MTTMKYQLLEAGAVIILPIDAFRTSWKQLQLT